MKNKKKEEGEDNLYIPVNAIIPNAKPGYKAGNSLIDKINEDERKSFLKLNEEIKKMVEEVISNLKKSGMLEETISKYFEGVDVIDCYYCFTPNMYELSYNKKEHFSMYECENCKKTYRVDWEK